MVKEFTHEGYAIHITIMNNDYVKVLSVERNLQSTRQTIYFIDEKLAN